MGIHITYAKPLKGLILNHLRNFFIGGRRNLGQTTKTIKDYCALAQVSQSQFADDKGMRAYVPIRQMTKQASIFLAEMIYPDRRVHQKHGELLRRKATARRNGHIRLGAPKPGELPRAFPLDQCLQRFFNKRRFFFQAGYGLCLGNQGVVQCKGCTHGSTYFQRIKPIIETQELPLLLNALTPPSPTSPDCAAGPHPCP